MNKLIFTFPWIGHESFYFLLFLPVFFVIHEIRHVGRSHESSKLFGISHLDEKGFPCRD